MVYYLLTCHDLIIFRLNNFVFDLTDSRKFEALVFAYFQWPKFQKVPYTSLKFRKITEWAKLIHKLKGLLQSCEDTLFFFLRKIFG